jgi:hypothetical protein
LRRLVPTTFLEEENEKSLIDGRNKESRLEGDSSLERMEVSRDGLGT